MTALSRGALVLLLVCSVQACGLVAAPSAVPAPPRVLSLNGDWDCEPGPEDTAPPAWRHRAPVPGLVDLRTPQGEWSRHRFFWYRTTFLSPPLPPAGRLFLRLDQARYGTEVWLNGLRIGGSIRCYTSQEYDLTAALRRDTANELLVRVGSRDALKPEGAVGYDFELGANVPGIWGDVSLLLTGPVRQQWVQVIPHIDSGMAEVRVALSNLETAARSVTVSASVCDAAGRVVAPAQRQALDLAGRADSTIGFLLPIAQPRLWSPESPFLYEAVTEVAGSGGGGERVVTRFGMRQFEIRGADFFLNGKRIFLRGSNIAFHRLLSDPGRGALPWDTAWIRKVLVEIPKAAHFNFFRNHLGQMYNRWYDIADEGGILLQNEYAFWAVTGTREQIVDEFTRWIIDNRNHPSLVIWDPANEQHETHPQARMLSEQVVPAVRGLDPTRPWEFVDFIEDHPYIYSLGPVLTDRRFGFARSLADIAASATPTMLDEFVWFWLDSRGEPTTLTSFVLPRWLGNATTRDARLLYQAELATELVELFRRLRVDAIAPFIYLSMDGRATANWFLGDLARAETKPVVAALANALAPVGVSVELWDRHFFTGETRTVSVYLFDDEPESCDVTLKCSITDATGRAQGRLSERRVTVPASGMRIEPVVVTLPDTPGSWRLRAEIFSEVGAPLAHSVKPLHVFAPPAAPAAVRAARLMVLDPDDEITRFLLGKGCANVSRFDPAGLNGCEILILGEGALQQPDYARYIPLITAFVKNGHTLVVVEPEYGVESFSWKSCPLLADVNLRLRRRQDFDMGGYDSCFLPDDPAHPLWQDLSPEHFFLFNGAFGGEIVAEADVLSDLFLVPLAHSGLRLERPVVMESAYGRGVIVLSRVQVRGRLLVGGGEKLYDRRPDPVAQRYLLNLVSCYRDVSGYAERLRRQQPLRVVAATASSVQKGASDLEPCWAVDGDLATRWGSSNERDPQWFCVDFGSPRTVGRVVINWENAYARVYELQVSNTGKDWRTVRRVENGDGGTDTAAFEPVTARYLRMNGLERVNREWGYSFFEFSVFGK